MSAPLSPSQQTPRRAAAVEAIRRHPLGLASVLVTGAASLVGILGTQQGLAAAQLVVQAARQSWPAVAALGVFLAFLITLRALAVFLRALAVFQERDERTHQHLEQLAANQREDRERLGRMEENQERITVILERLVDRTAQGPYAVTMPPEGPQEVRGG